MYFALLTPSIGQIAHGVGHRFIWGPHKQWCKNIVRIDELPDGFNSLMDQKGSVSSLVDLRN